MGALTTDSRPTLHEIMSWPATVSIARACAALGVSRSHGYELAARDQFPVRLIRVGSRLVVVTAELVRALSAGDAA